MQVKINDNILLIGTAHVSKKSVNEVKKAVSNFQPDVVAVELCESRFKALTEKAKWENTPVTSLLKGNKVYLILAQTFLASIQRKIGKDLGVEPGAEMVAAIKAAKEKNLDVTLVDRDISITLKRAWKTMKFREKFRLMWEFLKAVVGFEEEELEQIDLKELMKQDVISAMMKEFGKIAPGASHVLIDERDQYIASKILDASENGKRKIVAVVGAGHLQGIKKHIEKGDTLKISDLKKLETVPKKRINLAKLVAYAIPVVFFAVIGWIALTGGTDAWERLYNAFLWWFLINGSLSALGALIARGHPLSIVTAFVAAPLTSLNPAVAAGWFAGIVEAKLRTPRVKDIYKLRELSSLKEFFNNGFIRLLMVVALANLGSMLGTWIALFYIAKLGLFG